MLTQYWSCKHMRTQDAASAGTNQRPGFRSGGAAQPITGQPLTSDLGLGPAPANCQNYSTGWEAKNLDQVSQDYGQTQPVFNLIIRLSIQRQKKPLWGSVVTVSCLGSKVAPGTRMQCQLQSYLAWQSVIVIRAFWIFLQNFSLSYRQRIEEVISALSNFPIFRYRFSPKCIYQQQQWQEKYIVTSCNLYLQWCSSFMSK